MAFNVYVSSKIGSEAVGIFGLVMSVYSFAVTLATTGLSLACTFIVSKCFAKGNFFDGLKAVKSCIVFSLVLSISTSILVLCFSKTISNHWLNSMVTPSPLYLIAIGLPFIAISSVLNGYFSAVRKAYKGAITQFVELIVKIIVSIILLKFGLSKGVEAICNCLILADVISEVCSCILIIILYKIDRWKYCTRKVSIITFKKEILKITFPVSVTTYIKSGLSTFKQFIIPSRLQAFGLSYNMALSEYGKVNGMTMSVIMFPIVFIGSFSNLLVPEFSSLLATGNKKRIHDLCHNIFMVTYIFSFYVSSILFIFSNEISLLVFNNLDCATYIKIISPLVLFMYPDNIIDNILKGLNRQFGVMTSNILDLIITISILYFLLPVIGINGYILAIYVSEIFNFTISFFQLYKVAKFKLSIMNYFIKPLIACLVGFILSSFTDNFVLRIIIFSISFAGIFLIYLKNPRFSNA